MTIKTILNTLDLIIGNEKAEDKKYYETESKDEKFIEMIKYFYSIENQEYINIVEEGDEESYPYKNPFAYTRVLDALEAILAMRKMNIIYYN